jgi:hypothetical protein
MEGNEEKGMFTVILPKKSGWKCELFGGKGGIVWHPAKGQVPNAFWRWMQFLAFGNRWSRDD